MITGLFILILAGVSQGLFILPLGFTRNWEWEHNWLMFSFLGMIVLNWLLALLLFPQLTTVYRQVPVKELLLLFSFGLLWGLGAVLFGIGMERLGMSLGYPVIMGLIAATGALLPMILTRPETLLTGKGMGVIAGCALVVAGILLCSRADAARTPKTEVSAASREPAVKDPRKNDPGTSRKPDAKPVLLSGLLIAVLAGLLSALPNMGMNLAVHTRQQAIAAGIAPTMAGNLVWLLFFSFGFIANAAYTLYLIRKKHNGREFKRSFGPHNVLLTFISAAFWIASFYLYGLSVNKLGEFGSIAGWPLFISISIVTGNLAGLWKGEWKNAAQGSLRLLRYGMLVFILAMIVIGLSDIL